MKRSTQSGSISSGGVYHGGFVLGSNHFQRQIAALLGHRTWKGSPGLSQKPVADPAQQALPL